ncbi:MAG: MFS transporter [Sphaerochaetaceae bacterium]|jgi:predicted MFS family arabinose efflux permease
MEMQQRTDVVQFWVLNIASFFGQMSIAMVNLAVVYHLRLKFGLSAQMIGIAASVYTFTYLLFCMAGGGLCARMRPRHCIELSMAGMGISVAWFAVSGTIASAFVALALYGAFMSMLWPQVEGWFSRGKEGAQLNHVSSAFNFSWSFGAGLSPYIAGVLVERSTTLPLFSGICVFAAVFLLIAIASAVEPGIRAVPSERAHVGTAHVIDQSTPLRFLCWSGIVLVYTGLSVVQTIFPLYAQDVMGIPESTAGLLLLIRGVATCFTFVILGKTSRWQFKLSFIIVTQLLFGGACFAGSLLHGGDSMAAFVAYGVFFLAFGVLFAIAYTLSMFHGASGCVNRSRRMMIHEVLLTIGTIVGAIFGGAIYERFGFDRILYVIAVLSCLLVLVELAAWLSGARRSRV